MGIQLPSISTDGRIGVFNPATGRIDYQTPTGAPAPVVALRQIALLLPQVASSLSEALTKATNVNVTLSPEVLGNPAKANAAREEILAKVRTSQEAARSAALADIESIQTSMASFAKSAEAEISRMIFSRPSTKDTTELLLRETREARAWGRVKPLLDKALPQGVPAVRKVAKEVATEAATGGDNDTIAALFAEVPSWAQANDQMGEVLFFDIEEALIAADPTKKDAVLLRQELRKGLNHMSLSLSQMKHAIQNQLTSVVVVDWAGQGATLTLAADPA